MNINDRKNLIQLSKNAAVAIQPLCEPLGKDNFDTRHKLIDTALRDFLQAAVEVAYFSDDANDHALLRRCVVSVIRECKTGMSFLGSYPIHVILFAIGTAYVAKRDFASIKTLLNEPVSIVDATNTFTKFKLTIARQACFTDIVSDWQSQPITLAAQQIVLSLIEPMTPGKDQLLDLLLFECLYLMTRWTEGRDGVDAHTPSHISLSTGNLKTQLVALLNGPLKDSLILSGFDVSEELLKPVKIQVETLTRI